MAIASTHLVNCSTATNIQTHPSKRGIYETYEVQPPTMEKRWNYSWMEALVAGMCLISSPLTFLTLLGEILGIYLHGGLEVSLVQSHLP